MPRLLAALTLLCVLALAERALGCPVCAQRSEGGLLGQIGLGAFVFSPWLVALCVGLYIRRGYKKDAALSETTQ